MNGSDIQKLLDQCLTGGVLTLKTDANPLGSTRIDDLLKGSFTGVLTATQGEAQVDADSVTYPKAMLRSEGFAFYSKTETVACVIKVKTGSDQKLDLAVSAAMPDGWTLSDSFIAIGSLAHSPLTEIKVASATIAVDSAVSAGQAAITAELTTANSTIAQLDWLLGKSVSVSGAAGFVTGPKGVAYPNLTLSSQKIQGPSISGFSFDLYLNLRAAAGRIDLSDGSWPLLTSVDLTVDLVTPRLTVPILIAILGADQTQYPVTLNPYVPAPTITNLSQLEGLTVGQPVALQETPIATLTLSSLSMIFDASAKYFRSLQITVDLGTDWTIIDNLKLAGLQAQLFVPTVWGGAPPQDGAPFAIAVTARFIIASAALNVTIAYPDKTVSLSLAPSTVIDIKAFVDAISPGVFPPGKGDLIIWSLAGRADVPNSTYSITAAAAGDLTIIDGFVLNSIEFRIVWANKKVDQFQFGAAFTIANAPLFAQVVYGDKNWSISGGIAEDRSVNLSDLVADIDKIFHVKLPSELPHIELNALAMSYQTRDSSFTFEAAASFKSTDDPVLTKIEGDLKLNYDGITKNWTGVVSGSIVLNQTNRFTVTYDFRANSVVSLSWEATGSETIGIDDLCKVFGSPDMQQMIPKDLDLALRAVKGKYDITTQTVVFECESRRWGKADIAVWNDKTTGWNIFFGVDINVAISLTNIPLIGKALISAVGTVSLDEIQAAVSRPNLTPEQAKKLAGEIDTGYPTPPDSGLPSGAALVMIFDASGNKSRISIGTPDSRGVPPLLLLLPGPKIPGPPGEALAAAASDGAIWFALQKSFGPVTIDKVGVRYSGGKLWALMNASVAAGSLVIAAEGLGVGSPLSNFTPSFTVDGIVVSLKAGPVAFSGALVGKIDPVDLYGEFSLVFAKFSIGAIAGYADYQLHPSFFLFGVLNATLGGPPFFFVTGLAAGFGLNRSLLVPDVSGVDQFPLVEWAQGINKPDASGGIGDQVQKAMGKLETSGVIAPNIGQYWLAAGIRFTSFEMVDSFALAIVKFGNQLELDLLGLCTMAVPPAPSKAVAEVQLALKATIQPAIGLIGISGQLTANSYVLSKQAKLTGGFAYYMWVGGEHAGEFVLSLGGYSPKYQVPDYYPTVPRLGLAWKQDCLSITGELYFALTSSAAMAGGSLSAVWQSDDIRAWFDVQADFLILFTPFHYYVHASIDLGASVRINLKFTQFTLSIHLGVSIELYGPEFSGKVHVDLSIVSFTIALGAEPTPVKNSISWNDFVAQLLPSEPPKLSATDRRRRLSLMAAKRMRLAANAPAPPPAVLQIVGLEGILQTLSTEEGKLNWLVDGQTFQAQVQTVIPLRTYSLQGPGVVLAPPPEQPPGPPNFDFGCSPAGIASGGLHSNLEVSLTSEKAAVLDAVMVLGSVSKALWNKPPNFDDHGTPTDVDPVNDTTIKNVLTGFTLIPTVQKPDRTKLPIPLRYLKYFLDPNKESFTWSAAVVQTTDPFVASDTVPSTIAAPLATSNRPPLLAAIRRAKLEVDQTPDVSTLASKDSNYLLSSPLLRYLGEVKR
ncbi:MAG: hypothetical protein JO161_08505 [Planctomycetaceae bacterium]|nr:hypothetical protein [Planctomycetaceae bacterium]